MVKDNKKVKFLRYRGGEFIYATECGFEFPVPLEDLGKATLLAEDKALVFLRYIRKHIEAVIKDDIHIIDSITSTNPNITDDVSVVGVLRAFDELAKGGLPPIGFDEKVEIKNDVATEVNFLRQIKPEEIQKLGEESAERLLKSLNDHTGLTPI